MVCQNGLTVCSRQILSYIFGNNIIYLSTYFSLLLKASSVSFVLVIGFLISILVTHSFLRYL